MRILLTTILFSLTLIVYPQINGSRSEGLNGITIGLEDLFSAIDNKATLSKIEAFSAGISVQNKYMLSNLNQASLAVAFPIVKGTGGIYFSTYGYHLYQEIKIGIVYSLSLSPQFSMGVSINYSSLILGDNLGKQHAFYPDVGLNFSPTDKLKVGVQIQNISFSKKVEHLNELWLVAGRLGGVYSISKKLIIAMQGSVLQGSEFIFDAGMEYSFASRFAFRFGFSPQPSSVSMGFGFKVRSFKIDLASSYKPTLGFTPSINLVFINEK